MNPPPPPRAGWIVGISVVVISVSGYFMGLRQTSSQISLSRPVSLAVPDPARSRDSVDGPVPVAVRYADQNWLRDGVNAGRDRTLAALVQPAPAAPPVAPATGEEWLAAVHERTRRRAFDGAPPVVPHPIVQDSAVSCLACHAGGLVVKDRIAPRMSHAPHASCTQCHVPTGGPPSEDPRWLAAPAGNGFAGLVRSGRGSRAWEGAPPTIPHAVWMREDCLSCHGERGAPALRTRHPERVACTQCHVPQPGLEQRPMPGTVAGTAVPAGFPDGGNGDPGALP